MAKVKDLSKLSVKELRAEAVKLGMPENDAEVFETKKPLIATISTLQAQKAVAYKETPAEEKKAVKSYETKVERMRDFLESSDTAGFMIPLGIGEKPGVVVKNKESKMFMIVHGKSIPTALVKGAAEIFSMNGLKIIYPKGVMIEAMPQPIVKHLSRSYNMVAQAGEEFRADRIDPKTGKPVSEQL